jgi:hypothetical protein
MLLREDVPVRKVLLHHRLPTWLRMPE